MSSRATSSIGRGGRAHRPLPMGARTWGEDSSRAFMSSTLATTSPVTGKPHFNSTFPLAPRCQPASHSDFASNFMGMDFNGGGSSSFRDPGSTAKALAALQQAKYERQERRRAFSLLAFLLITAVTVYFSSSGLIKFSSPGRNHLVELPKNKFRGTSMATDVDADIEEAYGDNYEESGGGDDGKDKRKGADNGDRPVAVPPLEVEEEENEVMEQYTSIAEFTSMKEDSDLPFFWHIPRCAGSTMKDILGQCVGLTAASEVGVREGHQYDQGLQVVDYKGQKFVNVDTTSIAGISRAKDLGLAFSGIAQVVVSSYVSETATLFDGNHKGRAFTLMRDPIERAVSMFYYTKEQNEALSDLSLSDFARGNGIENNWMVRYLVNQMEGELDRGALEKAKDVLKRKFLVGLVSEKTESMARMQKYMEWSTPDGDVAAEEKRQDCIENLLNNGVNLGSGYDMPKKGSQERALIAHQTQYDLKLYEFAKFLFDGEQGKKWGTKEWKKALKKKKAKEAKRKG